MAALKPAELFSSLGTVKAQPRFILIHGNDHNAVRDLCLKVIERVLGKSHDDLALSHFTEAQVAKDRLYEEFAARSMFGEQRVVWVSEAGDALSRQLEPILADSVAGNLLLIDAEALPKTSKLRKLFEQHAHSAAVAVYEESAHELRARLFSMIKAAHTTISDEAMDRFMELVSNDRAVSESEVQKLVLYAAGQTTLTLDDVEAVCGDTSEASYDELVDAVMEGALGKIDRLTTALAQASGRSVLSALLQHIVKLQNMSLQIGPGSNIEAIVAHPRNAIFFKRRATITRQLRNWRLEDLLRAEEKINTAILQTRQYPALEETLINRTLLALGRSART